MPGQRSKRSLRRRDRERQKNCQAKDKPRIPRTKVGSRIVLFHVDFSQMKRLFLKIYKVK